MTVKTIYIARHGYRANWDKGYQAVYPTGVDSDPPLSNPRGVNQAKELAAFFGSIEPKPEIIFSSPFYRCIETAEPIALGLGIKIELERGIGEWFKTNRSVIPQPANYEQFCTWFKKVLSNEWTSTVIPKKEGETEEDIFQRTKEFMAKFVPKFQQQYPEIETILFVSHAAPKIALGMGLLGFSSVYDYLDEDETVLKAGAASVDKYELDPAHKSWKLKMNGNTEFLTGGEVMNWHFRNKVEAGSADDLKARAKTQKSTEYQDFYVTLEIPTIGPSERTLDSFSSAQSQSKPAPTVTNSSRKHIPVNKTTKTLDQSLNLNDYSNIQTIAATSVLQASGLETKDPLVKVNDSIFKGQWSKLVGTELIMDDQAEVVAVVRDHLELKTGTLKEKQSNEGDEVVVKNNLLERALKAAREKAGEKTESPQEDVEMKES